MALSKIEVRLSLVYYLSRQMLLDVAGRLPPERAQVVLLNRDELNERLVSVGESPVHLEFGQRQNGRREAARSAFAKELMNEPGNVGYDTDGNLVRTLGGGKVEIIDPAVLDDPKTK
jgi:hypothetical protein